MKQLLFSKALLSAATLMVGALAFTACSNEDYDGDTNPTYDGESVKTQFAINIPYAKGSTRMTAENTQENGKPFLGMSNIRLLAFDGEPGNNGTMSSMIPLVDIATDGLTDSHYKLYNDVNVAVGTDNFLFYATAPMGTDATTKFAKGSIVSTLDGKTTVGDIKFNLETVDAGDTDGQEDKLLAVLNAVAKVSGWKDGSGVDQDLKDLYTSFTSMTAGSANSIRLALQNLYNTVGIWVDASDENASKTVATAIRNAITGNYNGTQIFIATANENGDDTYTLATTLTYPGNRNLPDGAVKLKYDDEKSEFDYDNSVNVTGLTSLDVSKVCYPASLYYFINTDLAASDESQTTWPSSVADWASKDWTGWNNEVLATTRTIALKKNIQYAVANLALTVQCTKASLQDKGTDDAPARYITVPATGFKVTGLLIGGQPIDVDWKFEPASDNFICTIYDKISNVYAKTDATGGTNYTLALSDTATTSRVVNFAIELENNSTVEFRGVDGIVPVGGKFYLIGQLDPSSTNATNKTNFTIPHVFASDYQTVVAAKISTLANAYNTIPDLRATQMNLGLSVDLTWQTGIKFDVEIGGN